MDSDILSRGQWLSADRLSGSPSVFGHSLHFQLLARSPLPAIPYSRFSILYSLFTFPLGDPNGIHVRGERASRRYRNPTMTAKLSFRHVTSTAKPASFSNSISRSSVK